MLHDLKLICTAGRSKLMIKIIRSKMPPMRVRCLPWKVLKKMLVEWRR